jgi:hypothetical protein
MVVGLLFSPELPVGYPRRVNERLFHITIRFQNHNTLTPNSTILE